MLSIAGIGFNKENKSCFYNHLLEHLLPIFPQMKISNEVEEKADVLIINLTKTTAVHLFKQKLPSDTSFVIIIAHEITRDALPFIKLADHVIFINDIQKYVCEDFLEMDCSSSVLPYPFGEGIVHKTDSSNCFIYFEGDGFSLDESHYYSQIELALQWYQYDTIENYYFVFEVDPGLTEQFDQFKQKMTANDHRFCFFNARELSIEQIYTLLEECFCGHVFKNEITLDQYIDALENRQSWILHDTLSESPVASAIRHAQLITGPIAGKSFFNFNNQNDSRWNSWHQEMMHLAPFKKQLAPIVETDSLKDLNIIGGQPLGNHFIFSVCFRNQEDKIIRCLQSIVNQNNLLDFGIVIVSDQSNDRSLDLILEFIKEHKLDVCIVDNKNRKFAAKNFYNVAHHLVTNDESIIIEIDGDDFLAHSQVLDVLETYYKQGALKTSGSYKMFPEEQTIISQKEIEFNHTNFDISNPWSLHCTSWLPLRSAKRHLICRVELDYFLERKSKQWLTSSHDISIQPRLIELSTDKTFFVKETLYCYDMSGEFHDHNMAESPEEKILDSYKKLHKIYHPIFTH